jgi:anti-anti-sigma factor
MTAPGVLKLVGELDLAGVPDVQARLARLNGDIAVDASEVTFFDASALGMFVGVHRRCEARGDKLVLVNPSACMTRLFELTGLDALFNVITEEAG